MQCGLSLCVKGKCSVVCHYVLRGKCSVVCHCVFKGKCSVVCHCVFKRVSAVWSVIVVLRG